MTRTEKSARSQEEVSALVGANVHLVGWVRRRLRLPPPPRLCEDELYSAGLDGLWRAALSYDGSRGVRFCTLAVHCIRNRMLDAVLRQRRRWRRLRAVSLDRLAEGHGWRPTAGAGGGDPSRPQQLREEAARALALLRPREKELATRVAEGATQAELAGEWGVSRQRVQQLLRRAGERVGRLLSRGAVGRPRAER